jgi:tripartite-type tricarboxylate transporter receptor subunit TctC
MQVASRIRGTATAIALVLLALPAAAQEWPTRPIRIMVGFGAGGGTDVVTRFVAEPLSEILGQRVVVENKPGAGGTIAGDIIAKGSKDGYDALMISAGHTVSAVMIKAQNYDAVKDFTPVAVVANSVICVIAGKGQPFNDLKSLIEHAKKNPGKLNYGTVGIGSTQHLTAELLRQKAGIEAQAVSFRTTPEVVTALIRGDIAFAVDLAHAVRGQVQSGDLKILAVTTGKRWPTLPNVPTVIEAGVPDIDVLGWYGLVFPAGVPPVAIEKTRRGLEQVLARDNVRNQLLNVGALPNLSTPQEFGTLIEQEVVRWRGVATTAKLQPQ